MVFCTVVKIKQFLVAIYSVVKIKVFGGYFVPCLG